MKKLKLLLMLFILTSCSSEDYIYVKNIAVEKSETGYAVTYYCYDFESKDEITEYRYENINLDGIVSNSFSDQNFSLRLCENAFINNDAINEINTVIKFLISIKIPITRNIICSDNVIEISDSENSKLYNFSVNDDNYSGFVISTTTDGKENGAIQIINGKIIRVIDNNTQNLYCALSGNKSEIDYVFNDGKYYARLNNFYIFYSYESGVIYANIFVNIKSHKGIKNSITEKQNFEKNLNADLTNKIEKLYNDVNLNLDWYENQVSNHKSNIKIKIHIV